ncbi:MAG: hypothetical protein IPL49_08065 [Saprospirales bacterium]|nr:hypothetical protein [Saprospirales bacterium]
MRPSVLNSMNEKAGNRIMRLSFSLLLSVFFLSGFVADVSAAIINVPGDQPTIQAAINVANPGDVIIVAAGTYTEQINLNKSVTIDGTDKTTTFFQGDITFPAIGGGKYFMLISGAGAGATIQNITFHKTDKTGPQT